MKQRRSLAVLFAGVAVVLASPGSASAQADVEVKLNGRAATRGLLVESTVYVPVADLRTLLQAEVRVDGATLQLAGGGVLSTRVRTEASGAYVPLEDVARAVGGQVVGSGGSHDLRASGCAGPCRPRLSPVSGAARPGAVTRAGSAPPRPRDNAAEFKPIFGPPGRGMGGARAAQVSSFGNQSCAGSCLAVSGSGGRAAGQVELTPAEAGPGGGPIRRVAAGVILPQDQPREVRVGVNGRDIFGIQDNGLRGRLTPLLSSPYQYEISEGGRTVRSGSGGPGDAVDIAGMQDFHRFDVEISGDPSRVTLTHGNHRVVLTFTSASVPPLRTLDVEVNGVAEFAVTDVRVQQ